MPEEPEDLDEIDISELDFPPQDQGEWNMMAIQNTLEEILYSQERFRQARREDHKDIIDRVDTLEELRGDLEILEQENQKLRKKVDQFQTSIPIPVYGLIAIGFIILAYGVAFANDLIYSLGGIGLIIIAISAFIESKYRKNRMI